MVAESLSNCGCIIATDSCAVNTCRGESDIVVYVLRSYSTFARSAVSVVDSS